MFETIATLPWPIYMCIFSCGAAVYGIGLKFVTHETGPLFFSAVFTGLVLVWEAAALAISYWGFDADISLERRGIIGAVFTGMFFVILDVGAIFMYRAGAPLSLGMPLVRSMAAVSTALIGVMMFHEDLTVTKGIGILLAAAGIYLMGRREKV